MRGPLKRSVQALVASAVVLCGCPAEPTPEPEREPFALARVDGWARVIDPSVDLFADQRPADAVCDDAGWYLDPFKQTLEIETELCNYLTLRQATLEALVPGDVVNVLAFHDVLTAPDPGEGYLALSIDGEIEWEFHAPIPSDAAEIDETFTIDRAVPAGSEMQLHVHNHGPNSWELVALMVTPAQ
ncbi:hypothetical protein ENSA5_27760 [Enhygromyxa salina]|uniref:Lipoprotein n=1 Tax=Enhygromyxa salina TaxID=215803 RepID=A0A2S9Y7K8_9BACT|nr:hypothetical protein [Enhygromyxa salina]PRQ01094.1 hypothetical protein ENSA5_27760 [Enhygromyxa salina]